MPTSTRITLPTQPSGELTIEWMPNELGGEFAQIPGGYLDLVAERTAAAVAFRYYVTLQRDGELQEERITSFCDDIETAKSQSSAWVRESTSTAQAGRKDADHMLEMLEAQACRDATTLKEIGHRRPPPR